MTEPTGRKRVLESERLGFVTLVREDILTMTAWFQNLEFGAYLRGAVSRPMTLEAEIVHWADECSAKANSFVESAGDPSNFTSGGEFSERVWMLDNRRLWQRPHGWE